MLRSLKEIRKMLKSSRKEHEHDERQRAIVDLRVIDDSDFLSPYSTGKHNVISADVSDFIEHSMQGIHPDEEIHIRIHSDVISDDEKTEYTQAIRNHYADKYRDSCFEKKQLQRTAVIMTIIAVVSLSFMIGLDISGLRSAVFTEIVDIFAWVFMWEAVDIFFLQCTMLSFKQKRYLRLADSEIEYLTLDEKENYKI